MKYNYKNITLREYPKGTYDQRIKEIKKIKKLYEKREGRKVTQNEARNLLIHEAAKRKSL